jgi:ubiquinone/menaquinone biosynthesis C-methylase UbiE
VIVVLPAMSQEYLDRVRPVTRSSAERLAGEFTAAILADAVRVGLGNRAGASTVDHIEAGRYWNDNAVAWSSLSRAGYDVYRDSFNTPTFLEMLPDVKGLCGLDIGCGDGHNTRVVAERGANMTAIDISDVFIRVAQECRSPPGIEFRVASAIDLPFSSESFDFATSFMCFMDVPETDRAISEAYRVLKPGGFLQFSISHPCFDTPHRRNVRTADDKCVAVEVGQYFRETEGELSEWIFTAAPASAVSAFGKFKVPRFTRTLSYWINTLIAVGFTIERLGEPYPNDDVVNKFPSVQGAQVVAFFLHARVRKPPAAAPERYPHA